MSGSDCYADMNVNNIKRKYETYQTEKNVNVLLAYFTDDICNTQIWTNMCTMVYKLKEQSQNKNGTWCKNAFVIILRC